MRYHLRIFVNKVCYLYGVSNTYCLRSKNLLIYPHHNWKYSKLNFLFYRQSQTINC